MRETEKHDEMEVYEEKARERTRARTNARQSANESESTDRQKKSLKKTEPNKGRSNVGGRGGTGDLATFPLTTIKKMQLHNVCIKSLLPQNHAFMHIQNALTGETGFDVTHTRNLAL